VKQFPDFINQYLNNFTELEAYQKFFSNLNEGKDFSLSGLNSSSTALLVYNMFLKQKNDFLVIFSDESSAEKFRDDLDYFFNKDKTGFIPKLEKGIDSEHVSEVDSFFYNDVKNKLLDNQHYIYVATPAVKDIKFPSLETNKKNEILVETGMNYNREDFIDTIYRYGFERVDKTTFPRDYSIRASIIDIFIPGYSYPYRIEFFGDMVESIRKFDPETQRTVETLDKFSLYPLADSDLNVKNKATIFDILDYRQSTIIFFDKENIVIEEFDNIEAFQKIYRYKLLSKGINFPIYDVSIDKKTVKGLKAFINHNLEETTNFLLFSSEEKQVERLESLFNNYHIHIQNGYFSSSFYCKNIDTYFISETDVLSHSYRTGFKNKRLPSDIDVQDVDINDVTRGDFMVHVDYGIGKFDGLEKVDAFGSTNECLKLKYKGASKIYVPLEKIKDVKKYRNTGENPPKLTKLNCGEWERKKAKTKESAEEIVEELITLYSIRQKAEGYSFSRDDELQIEMESEFPHQETPDQIQATEEIKEDMESRKPMDRLLCGDVGFGKTEVAIRAAFKAVLDNKQVAILAPTTILVDQHYCSFKERLNNYPVIIEKLSRFVTKKEQNRIVSDLKSGTVDILIGTHRILSDDIDFDNLGLLIIDEEHRFGVKSKEKIKNVKKNLDVLSLTATPIPRTLQFSLIGARDFSQIKTPPKFRLPIVTEIINFNEDFIRKRINFELSRNGQVYFVHNKIQTIKTMTTKIHSIVPGASIAYAHGRMPEKKLEKIVNSFINNELDILVTTTIIESGIDIGNVNTMFVNKAHNFGLAQLYQLRGRVGRSNKRAFCYLIAPKMKKLNDSAVKRLKTIKRYTSLGSGYNIALSDMEIRGTGNLFGVEQSGNIQRIGYDLYVNILQETFQDKKDKISQAVNLQTEEKNTIKERNVKIISPFSAYIPDDYVESQKLRLEIYQRISESNKIENIKDIKNELRDRFGKLPEELKNLIEISKTKIIADQANVNRIVVKNSGKSELTFDKSGIKDNINNVLLQVKKTCNKRDISYKFKPSENLVLIVNFQDSAFWEHLNRFLLELSDKL
jgi:transcription-repair coupling factor (superfamily II helicase)